MKASHLQGLRAAAVALGVAALASGRLAATPIAVVEEGAGANEVVNVSSSTLGDNLWVYACAIDVLVDGITTTGFCIDPWHWSLSGTMAYDSESLANGPKVADGMGAATALQIEQLWEEYYTPTISNSTAAGLQMAIWDLVSASVGAATGGAYWYTLNSGDDYGASAMVAWVEANPNAAAANLVAITGPGQDYVISASALPGATIDAPPTAYTGSPLSVSSLATAPGDNLTLHLIEWESPAGTWTENTAPASGATDNLTIGITFPTTGLWTVCAGASTDGGNTWFYSTSQQVNVTSGITAYTLETMAVPSSGAANWYTASPIVQKVYQVQHLNP